ncbi:hypothetical protein J7M22_12665 [Candidatus Poribacteria bacterium]|nr:hypothetical protein [Candidatus Poribacteria bacterium]
MAIDDFLKRLIEEDDPLIVIWQQMLELYQVDDFPSDLIRFYNERETRLSQLEEALYHGYWEIYDLCFRRSQAQSGDYVFERLREGYVVIIADSLSLREVGIMGKLLNDLGWYIEEKTFAVASFPTLTESLSRILLGTTYPAGGKDVPAFRYRYVAGPGEVPNLPVGEPTLIWLRLPDKKLEQVTVAQVTTIADAFNATMETLIQLLEQITTRPVFITSDHGYLYATDISHYWKMPGSIEKEVRKLFPRESRAQPSDKEGMERLPYTKQGNQRYFVRSDTHVGILGRYWWASAKPGDRCTAHGGLSLIETLVPAIKVRKNRISLHRVPAPEKRGQNFIGEEWR